MDKNGNLSATEVQSNKLRETDIYVGALGVGAVALAGIGLVKGGQKAYNSIKNVAEGAEARLSRAIEANKTK